MKTFKMLSIALLMSGISVLAGCGDSDQIISSGVPGTTDKSVVQKGGNVPLPVPVIPTYRERLRLKPHRSHTFEFSNTGFGSFNAIDVTDLTVYSVRDKVPSDCQNISIYGDSNVDTYIGCHASGIYYTRITIENLTSQFLDLDVSLLGSKLKD